MSISMRDWEQFKVDIPLGKKGSWEIKHKTMKMSNMLSLFSMDGGSFGRHVPPGTYTILTRNDSVIMSDTRDEIRDHFEPIRKASELGGRCLVNGLGIGMVTSAMLGMENVEHVRVIEIDQDVIDMVAPTLTKRYGDRFEVIRADALEYKAPKGEKFSVVWHDIWPSICADNLPTMGKLHRKYARRSEWQGSWAHDICKRLKRQEYDDSRRGWGW